MFYSIEIIETNIFIKIKILLISVKQQPLHPYMVDISYSVVVSSIQLLKHCEVKGLA